jgi:hypothetical protein
VGAAFRRPETGRWSKDQRPFCVRARHSLERLVDLVPALATDAIPLVQGGWDSDCVGLVAPRSKRK